MHLQTLDLIVVGVYFVGLIALGSSLKDQSSTDQYFLAARKTSALMAGISVVATLLSTVSYLALPGEMIRNGAGYFTSLLAFVFIIPTVNYVVIPTLMRLRAASIYDYLERRFNTGVRTLGAAVFIGIRLVWMSLILYIAARSLSPMTGWHVPTLIFIAGIVTLIYTTLGGMRAVIWSDFLQFIILLGGALFIPCYIAWLTASTPADWLNVFREAERTAVPLFSWDPTERTTIVGMVIMVYVWNICTHGADQVAAQRYLSTPSAATAQRSFWIFSLANVGLLALIMVVGVALFYFRLQDSNLSLAEFQQQIVHNADDVFPQFIARQLPAGASGLMLSALLAAAMSSVSSGINSISAVLATDFAARNRAHVSNSESLAKSRWLSVVAGAIAVAGALATHQLMLSTNWNFVDLMERINHLFVAPLGALFFAGICFRHVSAIAATIGFVCGVVASFAISFSQLLFDYDFSFMWIMPISFIVSLACSATVGWLRPRPG